MILYIYKSLNHNNINYCLFYFIISQTENLCNLIMNFIFNLIFFTKLIKQNYYNRINLVC